MTYLEPINSTTVDQGWELPQSVPEGISNRTEGNDDVEVLTATVHKEGKQGQWTEVGHLVSCLGQWSNSLFSIKMKNYYQFNTTALTCILSTLIFILFWLTLKKYV